ncbi:sensor histidine kinase [Leptospira perdikensis]|uniref:Histidine kinase n=1 Tax=Leptospira perdikensis TaxID=2484948 RepID=A0A4R9JLU1_9LEPT|nr:sensor histidine kinase [Leptospira perdikensis]TGL45630.1 histidine kinase [Leptospira perdikensis]
MTHYKRNHLWICRSVINHTKTLIVVLMLASCQKISPDKSLPKVLDGKLTLTESMFQDQTSIPLDGEWEFYYQKLLKPEDFRITHSKLEKETIRLPGFWNEIQRDGNIYDPRNFCTFRLHLTLPKQSIKTTLGFYIPHAFTTYRMYLNGSEISENGIVGTSAKDTKEYWLPKVVFFTPDSETAEIIIQVANFKSLNAGFRQSIEIGTQESIIRTKQIRLAFDIFLIASLFVISLYHFTLYLLRKKDLSLLYFSLYSFVSLIYKITSGEFFLLILFPDFEWLWLIKLFFLSIYLTFPLLLSFIGKVFPNEINKIPNHTFQFLFFSFSLLVLAPDSQWIEETLFPAEIVMLFCCIYIFGILTKAVLNKRDSALGFLFGFVFLFLTVLNDILFEKNLIKTEVYGPIGTFVLFFSQSFFLSKNHSKLHITIEKQKDELEQSVFLKDKIYHTNIHSKRMELELYKKSIQPHFLMNSLSAIRYWVSESPEKSALILDSLVGELRIILKVASKQLIPIGDELNLCKYHIGVMAMRMEKEYKFKTWGIDSTELIPPLIFHTLIENAFTHEDSPEAKLSFGIFKKNIGKDEKLFSNYCFIVYHHEKNKGTKLQNSGSGTGLEYIRLRLEESYPGKWHLTHGKSKNGYRVLIQIQKI